MGAAARERSIPTGEGLTFEKVWAMFQETDRRMKETERQMKENDRLLTKRMQETDRLIGKLGNRFGEMVEHLVVPSIIEKFNKLGFAFTRASENIKIIEPGNKKANAEIDILLENGDIAIAVEVKSKVNQDDVDSHVRRMEKLRRYADKKQDKRRYQGAMAGAIISDEVREYILKKGFYVIEQAGDTVRINIPKKFKPGEW